MREELVVAGVDDDTNVVDRSKEEEDVLCCKKEEDDDDDDDDDDPTLTFLGTNRREPLRKVRVKAANDNMIYFLLIIAISLE
mmetsp:Transcript_58193/g.65059  ORF Transcript_58193/g.65059 Transcript_58193/m.65059 type:complete len:82 (+) Transcript_58193:305-550(+)